MKPKHLMYMIALWAISLIIQNNASASLVWTPVPTGLDEQTLNSLTISTADPDLFLMASPTSLYRSLDGGKTWRAAFKLPKTESTIHQIAVHPQNVNYLYLLTTDGIYISTDQGINWYPSYFGLSIPSRDVLSITFHPRDRSQILLGTASGVYLSQDWGKTWASLFDELNHSRIETVCFHPTIKNLAYAISAASIYRLQIISQRVDKVWGVGLSPEKSDDPEQTDPSQIPENSADGKPELKYLVADEYGDFLLTAGDAGLFQSKDQGLTWRPVNASANSFREITDLLISPLDRSFLIASINGVFISSPGDRQIRELYKGLPTGYVHALAVSMDGKEELFALTSQGLYQLDRFSGFQATEVPLVPDSHEIFQKLSNWTDREPPVMEVQQMAVRYGNISNRKIQNWHRQSRLSALMPTFSVDTDWTTDSNVDLDRGSTNEKDVFITGPDDINFQWGMGLDWDLKRFIWSSDQTSIDSREKLMVELRESLLREVTRLYFERRRLQAEWLMLAANDPVTFFDSANRINELAAQIDALTGSYLNNRWVPPEQYAPSPTFRQISFADELSSQEENNKEIQTRSL